MSIRKENLKNDEVQYVRAAGNGACLFNSVAQNIHLDESIKGIQNLKITYLGDTSINSELDLLISKIHNRIGQIKKILVIKV